MVHHGGTEGTEVVVVRGLMGVDDRDCVELFRRRVTAEDAEGAEDFGVFHHGGTEGTESFWGGGKK